MNSFTKQLTLHGGLIALLFLLQFVLPAYHHSIIARVMVVSVYALGYNILFGYTGLLSLGHAMFFAAGMYAAGLMVKQFGWTPGPALAAGLVGAVLTSVIIGFLALRTSGVAFMILTLMFSQAFYLLIVHFQKYTGADSGFVIQPTDRILGGLDLTDPTVSYFTALILFATCLILTWRIVVSPFGRALVGIRENEERVRMLGYNVTGYKLLGVVLSGSMSGLSGAFYGLLFGYVGATFASVQYSIFPLLWVLLGGAGTVIGPFVGTLFMFYLIDLMSAVLPAYMIFVGAALVILILFARLGIVGEIRRHYAPWLP